MQLQLPLFPKEATMVSVNLGVYEKDGLVQYIVNGLPVDAHLTGDHNSFRYITSKFIAQRNIVGFILSLLLTTFGNLTVRRETTIFLKPMPDIQLFIPCYVDQLYPQTGMNMVKVLEKAGCSVSYNAKQTCCGQPAFNSGYRKEAKSVGEKFLRDFSENSHIVSPSGSCTGYVRNCFDKLFNNTAEHNLSKQIRGNIFEFTEYLTNVMDRDEFGAMFHARVAYHDSCGALRECGIKDGPRRLLSKVEGLELVEMVESETCCGFGGAFAVKFDSISVGMAQTKVKSALDTGAQYIVSTDVSCLMHIQGYINENNLPIQTIHIADVLAAGW